RPGGRHHLSHDARPRAEARPALHVPAHRPGLRPGDRDRSGLPDRRTGGVPAARGGPRGDRRPGARADRGPAPGRRRHGRGAARVTECTVVLTGFREPKSILSRIVAVRTPGQCPGAMTTLRAGRTTQATSRGTQTALPQAPPPARTVVPTARRRA